MSATESSGTADLRQGRESISSDPRARLLTGMPVSERHYRLAGVSTAVLEGGEGTPVVLLHGPGEHAPKWLSVIPGLAGNYRVIAPDLPGHGMSGPMEERAEPEHVLAWLDELIERTCPTPPALVGQILGGAIAARFAAAHGQRLSVLALSDTLGLVPFQPAPEFASALDAFLVQPDEQTHDGLWQRCAFDLDTLRDRMGERWALLKAYNLDRARAPDLKATQLALMERFGFPAIPASELMAIVVPTVLIWGRHDMATPLSVAEAASARYGWPLVVIDEAGDDPPIEQPDAFLQVLYGLLTGPA